MENKEDDYRRHRVQDKLTCPNNYYKHRLSVTIFVQEYIRLQHIYEQV